MEGDFPAIFYQDPATDIHFFSTENDPSSESLRLNIPQNFRIITLIAGPTRVVSDEHTVKDGLMMTMRAKRFFNRKCKIIRKIEKKKYADTLVIWCTGGLMEQDLMTSVLCKDDNEVIIRDRWTPPGSQSRQKLWSGTVARFNSKKNLNQAAMELKETDSSVKPVMFLSLFSNMINAECRLPSFDGESARLFISGKQSLSVGDWHDIKTVLRRLGEVQKVTLLTDIKEYGVISVVKYRFTSQALAAMMILDGMHCDHVGVLSVEIEETERVKAIMENVKSLMADL